MTRDGVATPSLELRTLCELESGLALLEELIAEDVRALRRAGSTVPLTIAGNEHFHTEAMARIRNAWRAEGRDFDVFLLSAKTRIAVWQCAHRGKAA